jgi:hypothetical protein
VTIKEDYKWDITPVFLLNADNLQSDMIMLEMSLPNRAGILTPVDGLEEVKQ